MNPHHHEALQALKRCRFLPGSWDKRFVHGLSYLGEYDMLTPKQEEWVEKMAYRYRRQLGRRLADAALAGNGGEATG